MNPPRGRYIGHFCPTSTLLELTAAETAELLSKGDYTECPRAAEYGLDGFGDMKPRELIRSLRRLARRHGWEFESQEGANHTKVRLRGKRAQIPRHATDLKTGLITCYS